MEEVQSPHKLLASQEARGSRSEVQRGTLGNGRRGQDPPGQVGMSSFLLTGDLVGYGFGGGWKYLSSSRDGHMS